MVNSDIESVQKYTAYATSVYSWLSWVENVQFWLRGCYRPVVDNATVVIIQLDTNETGQITG